VEIIKIVSREDKIQHVTLSDDEKGSSNNKENDNNGSIAEHLPEDLTSLDDQGRLNVIPSRPIVPVPIVPTVPSSVVPSAAATPTLAQATQSLQQLLFLHTYGEQGIKLSLIGMNHIY